MGRAIGRWYCPYFRIGMSKGFTLFLAVADLTSKIPTRKANSKLAATACER